MFLYRPHQCWKKIPSISQHWETDPVSQTWTPPRSWVDRCFCHPKLSTLLKNVFAQFRAAFIFDYPLSLQECVNDCADEMKGRLKAIKHNHMDITLQCQLFTLTLQVLRSNLCLLIPSIKGGRNHLKHENLDSVLIRPDPAICPTLIGSSLHRRHPRWPSFGFNFMSRSLSARPGN